MKHLNFELTKILVDVLGYDEEYPQMVWVKYSTAMPHLAYATILDEPLPDGTETWPAVTLGDAMYWLNDQPNNVYVWCEVEHNGVKPFFIGYVGTPQPNSKFREFTQEEAVEKALEEAINKIIPNDGKRI